MELTPQLLETQQFPEKWRGYDQDAVDEFLERVGAGLAELQDRLRSSVARVKELEETEPSAQSPSPAVAMEAKVPVSSAQPSAIEADVTAVAGALVLAQQAADAALAEATTEADRILTKAKADAAQIVRIAEAKNAVAASKMEEADTHVAALAEEALEEAKAEAARLIADAQTAAAKLRVDAKAEADRLTESAIEFSERHADEVASRRGEELKDLDVEIASRRREAAALQSQVNDRQRELRSVVDGLQSLVGRVGSLAGPEATAPESKPEPVARVAPAPEAAVIDLTADAAAADHAESCDAEAPADNSSQDLPKWATTRDAAPSMASRRGLTVVTSEPEAEAPVTEAPVTEVPYFAPVVAPAAEDVAAEPAPAVEETPTVDFISKVKATVEAAAVSAPSSDAGSPRVEVEVVSAKEPLAAGDARTAVVDDPFLAALRGPDRVEFDEAAQPDVERSSFKRRRRRRL